MSAELLAHIKKRLGYAFRDAALLQQALTHRSFHYQNNERLEFLGDALLESAISCQLYRQFPRLSEGELTRLRTQMVRGEHLAQKAQSLDLGLWLRLGPGERKAGGWRRESVLADALEALLAAVYLDSDYGQCEACILRLFAEDLQALEQQRQPHKDAKTRLQEHLQQRGLPLPEYAVLAEHGPEHSRSFEVEARAEGQQAQGRGNSRKRAEQQAAELLLQAITGKKS